MITKNLYEPFEIEFLETNECPLSGHKHTFFELVFIMEGTGVQCINEHKLPYAPDRMFLLCPQDCHSFQVSSPTRFFFLRFNQSYLNTQNKEWVQRLEFIFHNNNHLPGCILKNVSDKPLMRALVEALLREQVNKHNNHKELTQQIINTMITIASRNITLLRSISSKAEQSDTATQMINYIHFHIHEPENLKAEKVAATFNLSPTYVSEYFKKQTGESMQQYIIQYKLKLVETRLTYSDMRMNEIAYEFGFTDESHLSKAFKKYKGINPSEFRHKLKLQAS